MDIEQLLNAHAALTLGKDMVFRDYAQAGVPVAGCRGEWLMANGYCTDRVCSPLVP